MTTRKKTQEFSVTFDMNLVLSIPIVAETMEAALAKAQTYKAHDVVDVDHTEYIDSDIKVTGIYAG